MLSLIQGALGLASGSLVGFSFGQPADSQRVTIVNVVNVCQAIQRYPGRMRKGQPVLPKLESDL